VSGLRRALFATPADALLSLTLLALLGWGAVALLDWAATRADWAVVRLNSALLLLGRYPLAQQWRLWLLAALLAAQAGLSWGLLRASPRPDRRGRVPLWPRSDRLGAALLALLALLLPAALGLALPLQLRWWGLTALLLLLRWLSGRCRQELRAALRRLVPLMWPLLYIVGLWLIGGGLGLTAVTPSDWGGLLLTLLMASFAMALSFPLGLLLVLLGAGGALLTPENLVFYLKEAGLLLINHPGLRADVEITGLYALMASSLMLLPPLAWVVSSGGIREPIVRLEEWLQHRAESLVGVLALLIAAYLLYEGIHGLETMMAG